MVKYDELKKYEVISFDIYDTLIKRCVSSSEDVFEIVERLYNARYKEKIIDFKKNRVEAEKNARANKKNGEEEIELDDIYYCLSKNISKHCCNILKNIELEVECKICCKNIEIMDLYNNCIKNKDVIIISDMYLPKPTIEKILKKNGFSGYKKLYLSSEIKKTKATGSIYKYIIEELKIDSNKIVHIGDNIKSDVISSQKNGITARRWHNSKFKSKENNIQDVIIDCIINNHYTKDYFYDFGFKNLGPLLYGYSQWLHEEIIKNNIEKLFFLSRDGSIMRKAYELLYDDETTYMYASRRALIVPSLWKTTSVNDMLSMMNLPKSIKLIYLLERLGISHNDLIKLKKYNLELYKDYNLDKLINNKDFINYLESRKDEIERNSRIEYNNLIKYLNNISFSGNIGIVDIGWYGSMQNALERLLGQNIIGFYLGIHTKRKTQTNRMHGFLFESNKNIELDYDEYLFNSILEFAFSTFHGSTKRYKDDGTVELYDFEYTNTFEEKSLKKIQDGALKFIENMNEMGLTEIIEFDSYRSCKKLYQSCLYPKYKDSKMLGEIRLLDNGISLIGTDKNMLYYCAHPIKFYNDFKKSSWKIGFLKRVLIIPANYYKIVKGLKGG